MFKFKDGTTLELEDIAKIDCGGGSVLVQIRLNEFKDKTIDKIRVKKSESYADYQVDGAGEYTFEELFNALN